MMLSEPKSWNDFQVIFATGALVNALLSAVHTAFGVFAIKLLRRRVSHKRQSSNSITLLDYVTRLSN
jgi:hypothetical protein